MLSISEARDRLDRAALGGRLDPELIEALQTASGVLDDVLHADLEKYADGPMETFTIAHGQDTAQKVAAKLVADSIAFNVTPLPDDAWRFEVKTGEAERARERLGY